MKQKSKYKLFIGTRVAQLLKMFLPAISIFMLFIIMEGGETRQMVKINEKQRRISKGEKVDY